MTVNVGDFSLVSRNRFLKRKLVHRKLISFEKREKENRYYHWRCMRTRVAVDHMVKFLHIVSGGRFPFIGLPFGRNSEKQISHLSFSPLETAKEKVTSSFTIVLDFWLTMLIYANEMGPCFLYRSEEHF